MKYIWITLIFVILGCCNSKFCTIKDEDINNMYSSYVEEWKNKAKESFIKAEKEIFETKPLPKPDIVGPNPDPAKCICKGTGIIIHGDGHKTPCEYHSGQNLTTKKYQ